MLPREKRSTRTARRLRHTSFNPLPGVTPGETLITRRRSGGTNGFQSAPGCYPGRNRPASRSHPRDVRFQSAPGCYPGRNDDVYRRNGGWRVSIRSRVLPREKQAQILLVCGLDRQVSIRSRVLPREKRSRGRTGASSRVRFNPLPGVTPGETGLYQIVAYVRFVSIRSRVLPREKPATLHGSLNGQWFQSAPGCYPGRNAKGSRNQMSKSLVSIRSRVLPREKPEMGSHERTRVQVSIRSRVLPREKHLRRDNFRVFPCGVSIRSRVLPREKQRISVDDTGLQQFQSAPGCYPGRNRMCVVRIRRADRFQSAPGCYPGRNKLHCADCLRANCFNPLPGVTPGETLALLLRSNCDRCFNPLPGVTPGETLL